MPIAARILCFAIGATLLGACAPPPPSVAAPDYVPPPVHRPDAKRDLESPRRF